MKRGWVLGRLFEFWKPLGCIGERTASVLGPGILRRTGAFVPLPCARKYRKACRKTTKIGSAGFGRYRTKLAQAGLCGKPEAPMGEQRLSL